MLKMAAKGSQITRPSTTILMPMAQMVCRAVIPKCISKEKEKFTRVISIRISQKPLLIRNKLNSFLLFRRLWNQADVPARKTKTGAQKCVIHRVKNNIGVVVAIFKGSSVQASL